MGQKLNLLVPSATVEQADLIAHSIRRYAKNKGIGCVVKREDSTVMVLFM